MWQRPVAVRLVALLALLLLVPASSGCGAARGCMRYVQYRIDDLAETFDIGLTVTNRPTVAVYACFASVACLGYSNVQGHVLGLGGGQLGWIRHSNRCYGALFAGHEDVLWSKGPEWRQYSHPMGMDAILGSRWLPPPAYFPACTHYIHLLYIGIVANARYAEMLDFLLGFLTIDIACDDGRSRGKWFFQ